MPLQGSRFDFFASWRSPEPCLPYRHLSCTKLHSPALYRAGVLPSRFLGGGVQCVAATGRTPGLEPTGMTRYSETSTLSARTSRVKKIRPPTAVKTGNRHPYHLDADTSEMLLLFLTLASSTCCAATAPAIKSSTGPPARIFILRKTNENRQLVTRGRLGFWLGPKSTIQSPVLDCLGKMAGFDRVGSRQIGNGPRHLEDPVVSTGC